MISHKLFNNLDEINKWNEKEEPYNKKDVHPIIRDGSRSVVSVPVNILLKNGCNCKGRYDYHKDIWVVEIEDDQVQGWEYI